MAKHPESEEILAGYRTAARQGLIARFESIDSRQLFAAVIDLLPEAPARIADIGAGTGRDAAWFARQGHQVLAVEPVAELRSHDHPNIEWMNDLLPALSSAREQDAFDLVTLCGVWQHIDEDARRSSMGNLANMVGSDGLLMISLRHGPGADDRRVFPADPDLTIKAAIDRGFALVRRAQAPSAQAWNRELGVFWTWLVFKKVRSDRAQIETRHSKHHIRSSALIRPPALFPDRRFATSVR